MVTVDILLLQWFIETSSLVKCPDLAAGNKRKARSEVFNLHIE